MPSKKNPYLKSANLGVDPSSHTPPQKPVLQDPRQNSAARGGPPRGQKSHRDTMLQAPPQVQDTPHTHSESANAVEPEHAHDNTGPAVLKGEYELSSIRQLVDLNGDSPNFKVSFRVTGPAPFEAVVVDQNTLDSDEEISFKQVTDGVIEGTVTSTDNSPSDYYLVLRAKEPTKVTVYLYKEELPPVYIEGPSEEPSGRPSEDFVDEYISDRPSKLSKRTPLTFILILIAVGVIVLWLILGNSEGAVSSGGSVLAQKLTTFDF